MAYLSEIMYITPEEFDGELVPALREWSKELNRRGVKQLVWFVFGSVVKKNEAEVSPDPLLTLLGLRTEKKYFRSESDIDIGLVVPDGDDQVDLLLYEHDSPFNTASIGEHVLSLTRFTESWFKKRIPNLDDISNGTTQKLGVYGEVVLVELE